MKNRGSSKEKEKQALTLGRKRFAKISAVEGIKLSREAEDRLANFDRQKLSPKKRIQAIVAAHRRG